MPETNLMLRMAGKLQRTLERHVTEPDDALQSAVQEILLISKVLKKQNKIFAISCRNRWLTASARMEESLVGRLRRRGGRTCLALCHAMRPLRRTRDNASHSLQ